MCVIGFKKKRKKLRYTARNTSYSLVRFGDGRKTRYRKLSGISLGSVRYNPVIRLVTGRFGPIPVRTPGRFGPIPFRSGRFGPISGVGRLGPILGVVSAHFILYSF